MIETREIGKVYETGPVKFEALRQINLKVEQGEFVAVMGPSGSGKSTLMNILGCLDRPTTGVYMLDGTDVSGLDETALAQIRNEKIGFVFQTFNLLPHLSAHRNVELPLLYAGVSPGERRRRAAAVLERVGLLDHARHRPHEMSGGQKQLTAIARALVNNPAVILADEPTGNLDSRSGYRVMAFIQELHREGSTIILVTHEPEIAAHAQRIIHLRDGRLVKDEKVSNPLDALSLLQEWEQQQEVGL